MSLGSEIETETRSNHKMNSYRVEKISIIQRNFDRYNLALCLEGGVNNKNDYGCIDFGTVIFLAK